MSRARRLLAFGSAVVVAAVLAAACNRSGSSTERADDASDDVGPGDEATAIAGSAAPVGASTTVYERGMIDRGLTSFIAEARDDLASRLGIEPDAIEVLTAVLVTWPDASLGCPEQGRRYAQVATDGSVIELGVGDRVYRYHSGGSRRPFACDRPLTNPPEPFAAS